jgi:hypothetical protein
LLPVTTFSESRQIGVTQPAFASTSPARFNHTEFFIIHYTERFSAKSEAAKREYFFKTIDGYNFLKSSGII